MLSEYYFGECISVYSNIIWKYLKTFQKQNINFINLVYIKECMIREMAKNTPNYDPVRECFRLRLRINILIIQPNSFNTMYRHLFTLYYT